MSNIHINKSKKKLYLISIIFFNIVDTNYTLAAKEELYQEDLSILRPKIQWKDNSNHIYKNKRKVYKLNIINDCKDLLNSKIGIINIEQKITYDTKNELLENEQNFSSEKNIKHNDVHEEKYINIYTISCYYGSEKLLFDKEVKTLYKVLGKKIKNFKLYRDYKYNYYIVNIGTFLSEYEAQSFRFLSKRFKRYSIKKIKIKNEYNKVIHIINKDIDLE